MARVDDSKTEERLGLLRELLDLPLGPCEEMGPLGHGEHLGDLHSLTQSLLEYRAIDGGGRIGVGTFSPGEVDKIHAARHGEEWSGWARDYFDAMRRRGPDHEAIGRLHDRLVNECGLAELPSFKKAIGLLRVGRDHSLQAAHDRARQVATGEGRKLARHRDQLSDLYLSCWGPERAQAFRDEVTRLGEHRAKYFGDQAGALLCKALKNPKARTRSHKPAQSILLDAAVGLARLIQPRLERMAPTKAADLATTLMNEVLPLSQPLSRESVRSAMKRKR